MIFERPALFIGGHVPRDADPLRQVMAVAVEEAVLSLSGCDRAAEKDGTHFYGLYLLLAVAICRVCRPVHTFDNQPREDGQGSQAYCAEI